MRRLLLGSLTAAALLGAPAAHAGERLAPARAAAETAAFREQVLAVLARHASPIARNTLEAVREKRVVFDTLDRLTVADCRQLVEENPAQWSGVVSADECLEAPNGRATVPTRILERVSGYQHENRIYVRADGKVSDAAATLVHETNHVVNGTHHRYDTALEKLEEEYRAYWVALLYTDGRAPGPGYLAWLKGWIIEQYKLTGVSPSDVPDRPEGILDNRFPETIETVAALP